MAKKSMINRDIKRAKVVAKYQEKRQALKKIIKSPSSSNDQRLDAMVKLQALPRDASPVRMRNRCNLTGRPNGVYRKFGLGRTKLRERAMNGEVPGICKSSW